MCAFELTKNINKLNLVSIRINYNDVINWLDDTCIFNIVKRVRTFIRTLPQGPVRNIQIGHIYREVELPKNKVVAVELKSACYANLCTNIYRIILALESQGMWNWIPEVANFNSSTEENANVLVGEEMKRV